MKFIGTFVEDYWNILKKTLLEGMIEVVEGQRVLLDTEKHGGRIMLVIVLSVLKKKAASHQSLIIITVLMTIEKLCRTVTITTMNKM